MACECTRCRQLARALTSAEAALRRPRTLPAAGAAAALLVLALLLLVGAPAVVAALLGASVAGAVVGGMLLLRPRLDDDDRLAPLGIERWLCENDDDWPWWVLGGVTAFVGLLLVTSPGFALPLLVVGGLVAAVPSARRVLRGCARLA